MKYTHRIKIKIAFNNPIQQTLMVGGTKRKLDNKRKKEDFIYSIVPEENGVVLDILCFEKLAMKEKKEWVKAKRNLIKRKAVKKINITVSELSP
jgi:hypothetical protein